MEPGKLLRLSWSTSSHGFVVKVTDSCLENQSLVVTVTHMSYWWQQEWHPAEFAEPDL